MRRLLLCCGCLSFILVNLCRLVRFRGRVNVLWMLFVGLRMISLVLVRVILVSLWRLMSCCATCVGLCRWR